MLVSLYLPLLASLAVTALGGVIAGRVLRADPAGRAHDAMAGILGAGLGQAALMALGLGVEPAGQVWAPVQLATYLAAGFFGGAVVLTFGALVQRRTRKALAERIARQLKRAGLESLIRRR